MATLAALFELFFLADNRRFNRHNAPVIKGPHWGTLTITASLITNTPFVMCCQIVDGKLVPQIAGFTRDEIIDFLMNKETIYFLKLGLSLVLVAKAYHSVVLPLWKVVKRGVMEWMKERKEKREGKSKVYNPDV